MTSAQRGVCVACDANAAWLSLTMVYINTMALLCSTIFPLQILVTREKGLSSAGRAFCPYDARRERRQDDRRSCWFCDFYGCDKNGCIEANETCWNIIILLFGFFFVFFACCEHRKKIEQNFCMLLHVLFFLFIFCRERVLYGCAKWFVNLTYRESKHRSV